MDMKDFNSRVDQQIAERQKREAQQRGERRQQNVPVDVDRRSGVDRRLQARNGQVRGGVGCSMMALLAWVLARPAVADWLIARAKRTPYTHITGPDGSVYMQRYWLFNPYPANLSGNRPWWQFPISIRLHRIMREDDDRALHDHPWNARTFILRGWYREVRLERPCRVLWDFTQVETSYHRAAGGTARLRFGEFHRITHVSTGGVWTLFVTGKYRGTWGFLVGGVKVAWRKCLGLELAANCDTSNNRIEVPVPDWEPLAKDTAA